MLLDNNWNMANIQIESVEKPFDSPSVAMELFQLISKADAMGLLKDIGTIRALDGRAFQAVISRIEHAGLATGALAGKIPLKGPKLLELLEKINSALDASPVPQSEWQSVLGVLGHDLAAQLLHLSESSLRRYASGDRETPLDVAARLHFLAIVVGQLRGGYNDYGIRRWFVRPRTFLSGKSVVQALKPNWDPDSDMAQSIEKDARWVAA